jgi:ubiquitin C-terminal hydrolase
VSAYLTFKDALEILKEELGVDKKAQHRLWVLRRRWELLDMTARLVESDVASGSELLVESQISTPQGAYWPRDREDGSLHDRQLAVGKLMHIRRGHAWEAAEVVSSRESEVTVKLQDGSLESYSPNSDTIQPRPAGSIRKLVQVKGVGAVGLRNLGNTCYMNSITQSLSNTPLLKDFLLSETYSDSVNTTNSAGSNGRVSFEFGQVVKELWTTRTKAVNSKRLYNTFTHKVIQFKGHQQHDCHEFLGSLLDILHEDFISSGEASQLHSSKVIERPDREQEAKTADEQWKEIQGKQASVISSLFRGQTSTKISCSSCGYSKVLFDVFTNLSLPIPVSPQMIVEVTFVPRFGTPLRSSSLFSKSATLEAIVTRVSEVTGLDCSKLLLGEVVNGKIVRTYDSSLWTNPIRAHFPRQKLCLHAFEVLGSISEAEQDGKRTLAYLKPWGEFQAGDQIDVLDLMNVWDSARVIDVVGQDLTIRFDDAKSKNDERLPMNSLRLAPFRKLSKSKGEEILAIRLLNGVRDPVSKQFVPIGCPQVASIGSWYSASDLHELVFKMQKRFISGPQKDCARVITSVCYNAPYSLHVASPSGDSCGLCRRCGGCPLPIADTTLSQALKHPATIGLIALWSPEHFREYIETHPSLEANHDTEEAFSRPLDLTQCFDEFSKEEQVDWECEACKTMGSVGLQQQIWRVPDILVIVLKRFAYQAGVLEKITQTVTFPLLALDLSTWMRTESSSGLTRSTTAFQRAYDLYAVVNHSGTLSGGHYTTYCLNQTADSCRWLLYDDDQVFEVQGEPGETVVSQDAYLVCYRRRQFTSSNVVNLSY